MASDSTVDRYEVTKGCYVPLGTGTKFKRPGSIVSLDSVDADDLKGYVKKASKAKLKGRSELNTSVGTPTDFTLPAVTSMPVPATDPPTDTGGEVSPDGSEPSPTDERVGNEDDQRQGSV